MNLKKIILFSSGLLVLFSLCVFTFGRESEKILFHDETILDIVYADTTLIDNVEVEVVFDGEMIKNLELSMQNAILSTGNEHFEEKLKEEIKKEQNRKSQAVEIKGNAVLSYNPFIKSGLTVEQYNKILKGTGLEGCGQSFYTMEETYSVNGLFAIGVAFHESGYGKHKANTNNFYGMRGNSGWMSFESPDANIQYFGKLMNKSLYKGKSIENIGKVYCPGTYLHWAEAVKSMMKSSFNKI